MHTGNFVYLNAMKNNDLHLKRPVQEVLGEWFKAQNVSCVPSILGPLPVSNGTGNQGVDPKYRIAHLSGRLGEFLDRSEPACRCGAEGTATEDRMKTKDKDNGRKWMWRFLGVLVALQL